MKKLNIETIYEDENLIAVNKPSGISVIPERWDEDALSVNECLEKQYKQKIFVVHRIDKVTSGVVVFARNKKTHAALSKLFETRKVDKEYQAIIRGFFAHETFTAEYPLKEASNGRMVVDADGKESVTELKVLEHFRDYTLMEARPVTGRTHQIRVHLSYMGTPIVCDALYGFKEPLFLSSLKKKNFKLNAEEAEKPLISRTALHCRSIAFTLSRKKYRFETELPKDFKAVLNQLRKYNLTIKELVFG